MVEPPKGKSVKDLAAMFESNSNANQSKPMAPKPAPLIKKIDSSCLENKQKDSENQPEKSAAQIQQTIDDNIFQKNLDSMNQEKDRAETIKATVQASISKPAQQDSEDEHNDDDEESRPFEQNFGRQASQTEVVIKKKMVNIFQQNIDAANKAKEEQAKFRPPPPKKLVNPFLAGQEPVVQKPIQPPPKKLVSPFLAGQEPVVQKPIPQPIIQKIQSTPFSQKRVSSDSNDEGDQFSIASKSEVTQPKKIVNLFQQNIDAENKAKEEQAMKRPVPKKLVNPFLAGQEPVVQKPVQPPPKKLVNPFQPGQEPAITKPVQPPPAKLQADAWQKNDEKEETQEENKQVYPPVIVDVKLSAEEEEEKQNRQDFLARLNAMHARGPPQAAPIRRMTTQTPPSKKKLDNSDSGDENEKSNTDAKLDKIMSHQINPSKNLLEEANLHNAEMLQMKPKVVQKGRRTAKKFDPSLYDF